MRRPDLDHLLATAHALADAARAAAMPFFRSGGLSGDNKAASGYDPVTEADRAAERAMRDILSRERPEDGIEGEEFGAKPGRSGLVWHLDPVDGTRSFLAGLPSWTVLIGVAEANAPIIGVIDQPVLNERYVGADGASWLIAPQGRAELRTRPCSSLSEAVLSTTDPFLFRGEERDGFDRLRTRIRMTRYGFDAYAYARLAAGDIDLVLESGLQAHDMAALIPVIENAGGAAVDWDGGPAKLGGRLLAVGDPVLLAPALEQLAMAGV
jgi:histidinol phosphatase-like enzyme (inositol monophosphatase family)